MLLGISSRPSDSDSAIISDNLTVDTVMSSSSPALHPVSAPVVVTFSAVRLTIREGIWPSKRTSAPATRSLREWVSSHKHRTAVSVFVVAEYVLCQVFAAQSVDL